MRGFNTGRGWWDECGLARDVFGAGTAVSGVANAAASVAGATIQASAVKEAANTAAQSAKYGDDLAQGRYDATRGDLAPYQASGGAAASEIDADLPSWGASDTHYLDAASNLYGMQQADTGIAGDLFNQARQIGQGPGGQAALEQTPGYQFTLQQGLQATQNSAAARGLGVSGAALKGAASYATGLADQTYQQQYADAMGNAGAFLTLGQSYGAQGGQQAGLNAAAQGNLTNSYNRLLGVAGMGENAAAQTGTTGAGLANAAIGANSAGASGVAAAQIAGGNAAAGGINGAANAYGQYNAQNLLLKLQQGGSIYNGGGGDAKAYAAAMSPEAQSGGGYYGPGY